MPNDAKDLEDAAHGYSSDWRRPPPAGHYGFMSEATGACPWCSIGDHDGCFGPCECRIPPDALH
jgi:hypothetical protein